MDLKEILMDKKNHSTKSLLATWCLVSLCALFCLLAGCEEGMVDGPELAAAPDLAETAGADLEAVAKAVEKTLAEAGTLEPEPVTAQEAVVAIAEESAKADPAQETLAEAGTLEPEPVAGQEAVVAIAEDTAKADPAAAILAETIDPEPETVAEEEALADPAKEIGLEDPIPAKSLDITQDQADPAADLDKMHIADAPLLGDNANPLEEHQEMQVQKQGIGSEPGAGVAADAQGDQPPEAASSKGFVAKFFLTPGIAVLKFTGRHFIVLLAAVLCVAAFIVTKKKKLLSGGLRRRTNSHG